MECGENGERDRALEIGDADHMHEEAIVAFFWIVEACDPYTPGHQQRVASFVSDLAREMGLGENTIDGIYVSALILDIGKLQLSEEILGKAIQLNAAELSLIREHPEAGYDILKNIPLPWPVATIIHQHHERMDGTGYPQGLKGDEILLEARVVAVADVVESIAGRTHMSLVWGLRSHWRR